MVIKNVLSTVTKLFSSPVAEIQFPPLLPKGFLNRGHTAKKAEIEKKNRKEKDAKYMNISILGICFSKHQT